MSRIFKVVVLLLLGSTLVVQLLILRRMPVSLPSIARLQMATTPEAKRALLLSSPMVSVAGSVDVRIQDTPLEVEVVR